MSHDQTTAEKKVEERGQNVRSLRMSTSAEPTDVGEDSAKEGTYECHICFEQAKDAVVSYCGHLFW